MSNGEYNVEVRVNWNDTDRNPLVFTKTFSASGWPHNYHPEDFVSRVTEIGGLFHDNVFYPLHTIENIEFGKEIKEDKEK